MSVDPYFDFKGVRPDHIYGILPDFVLAKYKDMIDPFIPNQVREVDGKKVISYGLSSYGYDVRLADEFMIPYMKFGIIDPKNSTPMFDKEVHKEAFILPEHQFILGRSFEYIRMPRDVTAIAVGKSTYARCGVVGNVTPLEASWEGYITIEISNTSSRPVILYPNEGILQLLFFRGQYPCETSYADRHGKYQGQKTVTPSKV